jgi:hypothetical protein
MVILHHKISKANLVAIFALSTLILVIGTTTAIPQSSSTFPVPPKTVRLGIRDVALPVKEFCGEFKNSLEKKLPQEGYKLESTAKIVNEYSKRYEGLLLDRNNPSAIDIECGPNSEGSGNLRDANDREFSDHINFSDKAFHETGTKLLLKQGIAKELGSNKDKYSTKLKNLHIVVVENTTTDKKFNNKRDFYPKYFPVGKQVEGINDRDRALNALTKGIDGQNVDALASDAVIVQTLYDKGVIEQGDIDHKTQKNRRKPFKDDGFVVFPSSSYPAPDEQDYLPYLGTEKYVIAVRKENPQLLQIINDKVLTDLNNDNSQLAKASKAIGQFEKGEIQNTPTPTPTSTPTPTPPPPKPIWQEPVVLVAIIGALGTIIAAFINSQHPGSFFRVIRGLNPFRRKPSSTKLSSGRKLRGRVLDDATNKGIQGAQISLETEGLTSKTTDAEGMFIFPVESSEDDVRVFVQANGYQMYDKYVTFPQDKEVIVIKLSRVTQTNISQ